MNAKTPRRQDAKTPRRQDAKTPRVAGDANMYGPSKPVVLLWEHVGTGLIIPWPSGVEYSNQVCGTSCVQASNEGIFVPIGNDTSLSGELISPETKFFKYFQRSPHHGTGAPNGLNEKDATFIESCLHENFLHRNITVDRSLLKKSCESWVHVKLEKPCEEAHYPIYQGFEPFPISAILTWTNSD